MRFLADGLSRLHGHRPLRLPGLRSPGLAQAARRRPASRSSVIRRRSARCSPTSALGTSASTSTRSPRAACGSRRSRMARPVRELRCGAAALEAETLDGDARRLRRHLPADVLRRALARPRRLPAARRPAERPWRVLIRGCGREARAHGFAPRRCCSCASTRRTSSDCRGPRRSGCRSSSATGTEHPYRVDEFSAYHATVKRDFDAAMLAGSGRHVPRSGRALRHMRLRQAMRRAAQAGRPPLASRADAVGPGAGAAEPPASKR